MNMPSDEAILDRLIMAYKVNYHVLKAGHYDREQVLIDMAALWIEMVERIPESHSLQILSLVYGS